MNIPQRNRILEKEKWKPNCFQKWIHIINHIPVLGTNTKFQNKHKTSCLLFIWFWSFCAWENSEMLMLGL
jgi:hypothetical protein